MKIFLVGGAVRDKLLGIQSKDLDYVMVLDEDKVKGLKPEAGFLVMKDWMEREGFTIWLETPEMFTIRAKFPKGHKNEKQDADFVLARKEIGYEEGTRKPILELGTLYDDLSRRDFTVNAMAEDEDGNIIDYFNGKEDLNKRILKTPIDANITFMDDPLRMIRAFRCSITKGFMASEAVKNATSNPKVLEKLVDVVSQERIRDEFLKMFKYDTVKTMKLFVDIEQFYCKGFFDACFGKGMWLEPTFKAK